MGEEQNPLSGKVGLDVTEFKAGISQLNQQIRVIESGFKATAAGMGDWSKQSAGLEARMRALTGEIGLQQQKVENTRKAYQQMAAEKGATSRAAQDLQIKLNKETETLNRMQNELNQSESELGQLKSASGQAATGMNTLETETRQAGTQMSSLNSISSGLGGVLRGVGIGLAAVATAAAGAVVGIGAFVLKTAKTADDLDELSQKTGISTTRLQELGYIGKQSGTDLETMTGSLSRMIRSMDEAKKQGYWSPMATTFRNLGVAIKDNKGNFLDSETVMFNTINALGKIQDETKRDAIAMQIFGKSAMELNPLILLGADGMKQLTIEAHQMGAVMSEESIKNAADLNDKLDALKTGLQGTAMTLLTTLMPGLSGAGNMLMGFGEKLARIVDISQANPAGAQDILNSLIGDIAAQIPKLLQGGLKIIQGLLNGIMAALPALLPAAVQIITSLLTFVVQALPMLIEAGAQIVIALVNAILPMLPNILQAAIQIIVTLANGISQALPQLIPTITQIITQLILVLVQNLPLLIQAGMTLLSAIIQGLIAAIPILVMQVPVIVQAFVDAMVAAWPVIQQIGMQILAMLAVGISQALPGLIVGSQQIMATVGQALQDGLAAMLAIGKAIVDGVWKGIQAKKAEFYQQVVGFFAGIVNAVKTALKISSPSKLFADIGSNMAAGVGVGFARQIRDVERGIANAMGGLGGANVTLAGAGGGMNYNTQTVYNFGPVYYGGGGSGAGNPGNSSEALRY